jgi:hypothetical protein
MYEFKRGDLVLLNDRVAAIVGLGGEPGVPENHVALWYGEKIDSPSSDPVAWTVPAEFCLPAPKLRFLH